MVAERVKLPTTAAPARRQRQGEPEAAQQEDAKEGTGHGDVIPCGRNVEDTGSERPGLGKQHAACEMRE